MSIIEGLLVWQIGMTLVAYAVLRDWTRQERVDYASEIARAIRQAFGDFSE